MSPFAVALGNILAHRSGLQYVTISRVMPLDFILELVKTANAVYNNIHGDEHELSVIVSTSMTAQEAQGLQVVSSEELAKYRTNTGEDGGDCLAISYEGDFKTIKTLEPFRHIFPSLLPSVDPYLTYEQIFSDISLYEISKEIIDQLGIKDESYRNKITSVCTYVFNFLVNAYRIFGNDSIRWTDAWWRHMHLFTSRLIEFVEENKGEVIDKNIPNVVFAAAGLPAPDNNFEYKKNPKDYIEVLKNNWIDHEQVDLSLEELLVNRINNKEECDVHPLAENIEWDEYHVSIMSHRHPVLAFTNHLGSNKKTEDFCKGWGDTKEKEFFVKAKSNETIAIESGTAKVYQPESWDRQKIIIVPTTTEHHDNIIHVGELSIIIPWLNKDFMEDTSPLVLEDIKNTLTIKPKALTVTIENVEKRSDGLVLKLSMDYKIKDLSKWSEKTFKINWNIQHGIGLVGAIPSSATVEAYIANPFGLNVYYNQLDAKTKAKKKPQSSYLYSEDKDAELLIDLNDPGRYGVTIVNKCELSNEDILNRYKKEIEGKDPSITLLEMESVDVSSEYSIEVGGCEIIFSTSEENTSNQPWSPIIAVAQGTFPRHGVPAEEMLNDIRGKIENNIYTKRLLSISEKEIHTASLYQVFVTADSDEKVDDLEFDGCWYKSDNIPEHPVQPLSKNTLADDYPDLLEKFWRSFFDLGLQNISKKHAASGDTFLWPSRLDLQGISKEKIDNYLASYSDLCSKALESNDNNNYFWACYPFSIFIVNQREDLGFKGILLSPLHPIRLSWLWSVQQAISDEDNSHAVNLLQFIDGWNFPYVAKGPREIGGPMLHAVPLHSGYESIFIGWSFLAPLQDGNSEAPRYIASEAFPAGASSGLNEGGIAAAFRDYLRINPHLATLAIDLSATQRVPRSPEIDMGVVDELVSLAGEKSNFYLKGGVRVYDSIYREGNLPNKDEILRMLSKSNVKVPFVWQRYKPSEPHNTHIKFLQNSSVDLKEYQDDDGKFGAGFTTYYPLRRFHACQLFSNDGTSVYNPLVESGPFKTFHDALNQVEAAWNNNKVRIVSYLKPGQFSDVGNTKTDWLVSGNVPLSPIGINKGIQSAMQGNNLASKMLWEWRPSFLSRRSGSNVLEKRPYMTVATLPNTFIKVLKRKTGTLLPDGEISDEQINLLLSKLGERGIGLSSLLAIGHHHATGALGFYHAYKVIEQWEGKDVDYSIRFTLPIDAIDPILKILASDKDNDEQTKQRADLLVIDCYQVDGTWHVNLIPAEVKFYNTSTESKFKGKGSSEVKDAFSQLKTSYQCIQKIFSGKSDMKLSDQSGFVRNIFASLMHTAIMSTPSIANKYEEYNKLIESLLQGNALVNVSRGMLLWFQVLKGDSDDNVFLEKHANLPFVRLSVDPSKFGDSFWNKSITNELLTGKINELFSYMDTKEEPIKDDKIDIEGQAKQVEQKVIKDVDVVEHDDVTDTQTTGEDVAQEKDEVDDIPDYSIDDTQSSGINVNIGSTNNPFGTSSVLYEPSDTDLTQLNVGVVGDLGTGKTQFLKSLVYQVSSAATENRGVPPKFLIFDYKKDYISDDFINSINAKVIQPKDIALNFFDITASDSLNPEYDRAAFFTDIISRIYSGVGHIQKDNLIESIIECYSESETTPTIYDVKDKYADKVGDKVDSVLSILKALTLRGVFERDQAKVVPFQNMFNQTTIINLGALGTDQDMKNMLVTIFLNFYYEYMITRNKMPFISTEDGSKSYRFVDSYLLVDEAINIMRYDFDVLENLLLQGREFGIGIILSSQYFSHFFKSAKNWAQPLATWAIHRVPDAEQKSLKAIGITSDLSEISNEIKELDKHYCFYKGLSQECFVRGKPYYELMEEFNNKD